MAPFELDILTHLTLVKVVHGFIRFERVKLT